MGELLKLSIIDLNLRQRRKIIIMLGFVEKGGNTITGSIGLSTGCPYYGMQTVMAALERIAPPAPRKRSLSTV